MKTGENVKGLEQMLEKEVEKCPLLSQSRLVSSVYDAFVLFKTDMDVITCYHCSSCN